MAKNMVRENTPRLSISTQEPSTTTSSTRLVSCSIKAEKSTKVTSRRGKRTAKAHTLIRTGHTMKDSTRMIRDTAKANTSPTMIPTGKENGCTAKGKDSALWRWAPRSTFPSGSMEHPSALTTTWKAKWAPRRAGFPWKLSIRHDTATLKL